MAFEVPSHLKKSSSIPTSSETVPSTSTSPPSTSSAHVDSLLEPLVKEKWSTLTSKEVKKHKERVQKDVHDTKSRILKLVVDEYPRISSQLNGSLDARANTAELEQKVTGLEENVEGHPTTSLIPPLLVTLRNHSTLLHSHSKTLHRQTLLELLHSYRTSFSSLLSSKSLPNAVADWKVCSDLLHREEWSWNVEGGQGGGLINLKKDLEGRLRVERDRMAEELAGVWEGALRVGFETESGLGVITIKEPEKMSLESLIASLSTLSTLSTHITHLTTRLITQVFRPILSVPAVPPPSPNSQSSSTRYISTSTSTDGTLSIFRFSLSPIPPHSSSSSSATWTSVPYTLPLITSLLTFLSTSNAHLPPLPTLLPSIFPLVRTLHLEPSFPNLRSEGLPAFIETCREFASWQEEIGGPRSGELREFERAAGTKWVRWRRGDVLGRAREIIAGEETGGKGWEGWEWVRERVVDEGDPPLVELEVVPMVVDAPEHKLVEEPSSLPAEEEMAVDLAQEETPVEDDGWGFDEDAEAAPPAPPPPPPPPVIAEPPEEDDGWGFDASPSSSPPKPPPAFSKPSHGRKQSVDGWGFDPDSDDDASSKPLTPSAVAPRQARRLEKAQAKSKGHSGSTLSPVRSGSTSSSVREEVVEEERSSPVVRGGMKLGKKHSSSNLSLGSSSRRQGSENSPLDSPMFATEEAEEVVEEVVPERRGPTIVTERMVVSVRSKLVVEIAEEVIRDVEAMKLLPLDHISPLDSSPPTQPSVTLARALPDIFSLYRALMPVAHPAKIKEVPALAMQFVNDCAWLAEEARRLEGGESSISGEKMRALGERWFAGELAHQSHAMMEILDEAHAFVDSSSLQRSKDLEMCLKRVVFKMQLLSRVYKPILSTHLFLSALGSILNSVLARMLQETIALQDITTKESHRLNEVCKMIHPLEELFVEEVGMSSSVVAFVPLWLKFCYLSELLEASIADISYLFETGALIDFSTDELVSLMKALFSDTSLRAGTIDKIISSGGR
ncbi:hypothetical protein BDY24DRAFT_263485 [Mrakia frigida]|uniref:uncharacterized protein n=1 Tax=Mrakia frigida TaxID=29902 RepID=UPI003FCC1969